MFVWSQNDQITPFQVQQATKDGIKGKQLIWLQAHLGISWAVGCFFFGAFVVSNLTECRISKQVSISPTF